MGEGEEGGSLRWLGSGEAGGWQGEEAGVGRGSWETGPPSQEQEEAAH